MAQFVRLEETFIQKPGLSNDYQQNNVTHSAAQAFTWCVALAAGIERTMVFVETKRQADFIATFLCQEKVPTTSIHG